MNYQRLEKSRSAAAAAELQRLDRASSILSRSGVQDDYQLGILHTILAGTYGQRLQLGYAAMQQAKRLTDSSLVHDYLAAAESAHVDRWFGECDQDALVLTRYLAIRRGVVADAAHGIVTGLTVETMPDQTPQIMCIVGDVALRGSEVDVRFSSNYLLAPERHILAGDSER